MTAKQITGLTMIGAVWLPTLLALTLNITVFLSTWIYVVFVTGFGTGLLVGGGHRSL